MKPRTKEEILVVNLSRRMASISQHQQRYAIQCLTKKNAYIGKRKAWCNMCGGDLEERNTGNLVDTLTSEIVCPHCGSILNVQMLQNHRPYFIHNLYYTIVTTCKGYQVIRHFMFKQIDKKGSNVTYQLSEVAQCWQNQRGREYIIARSCASNAMYYDYWLLSSDMTLKGNVNRGYYGDSKYEINPDAIYSNVKLIPILKRNGLRNNFYGIAPSALTKSLIRHNDAEYLLKTRQIELLKYFVNRDYTKCPFKESVNICNRNKYIIEDASIWIDMMNALKAIGKDLRNRLYVCPNNLIAAHDNAVTMRRREEEKKVAEELRKKAYEANVSYISDKNNFLDLIISNSNITIRVLQNIKEFEEEGNAMHHCVFASQYYSKKDSLIMSARDKNGNRVETIELSLKSFNILQSRGVHNSISPYHEEIENLIKNNIDKIKKRCA